VGLGACTGPQTAAQTGDVATVVEALAAGKDVNDGHTQADLLALRADAARLDAGPQHESNSRHANFLRRWLPT